MDNTVNLFVSLLWRSTWQLALLTTLVWLLSRVSRKEYPVFTHTLWIIVLLKSLLPIHVDINPFFSWIPQSAAIFTNILPVPVSSIADSLPAVPWKTSVLIFWSAGVGLWGIRLWLNEFRFRKQLRAAHSWIPDRGIDHLRQKMNITRPVRLYTISSFQIPFTRGFFKPRIYLPEDARHWPDSERKGVLAHELAHIKRYDLAIIYLQALAGVLYFFHPAIWLINHHLDLERERICDDLAIETLGLDRRQYGRELFNRLEQSLQNPHTPLLAGGFLMSRKSLFRRFEYIIYTKGGSMTPLKPVHKVLTFLVLIAAVLISCNWNRAPLPVENQSPNPGLTGTTTDTPDVKFVPYDTPPEPLTSLTPVYPPEAREAGIEGTVIIQTLISKGGKTAETKVLQGVAESGLNKAAITAISETSWNPALSNGEPVSVWITIPIHFRLKEKESH